MTFDSGKNKYLYKLLIWYYLLEMLFFIQHSVVNQNIPLFTFFNNSGHELFCKYLFFPLTSFYGMTNYYLVFYMFVNY